MRRGILALCNKERKRRSLTSLILLRRAFLTGNVQKVSRWRSRANDELMIAYLTVEKQDNYRKVPECTKRLLGRALFKFLAKSVRDRWQNAPVG
jgi:hypothetical protein